MEPDPFRRMGSRENFTLKWISIHSVLHQTFTEYFRLLSVFQIKNHYNKVTLESTKSNHENVIIFERTIYEVK